jgi:type I restriction enzyme M protein
MGQDIEVIETSTRSQKVVDDDLPEIARAYRRFRARHPEPGTRR